jgi:hypothetical protein
MGTLDSPDKSRGVSFRLAIGPVSCAKTASWKLTPLSSATFVGCLTLCPSSVSYGFNVVAVPECPVTSDGKEPDAQALRLMFQLYKSGTYFRTNP